MNECHHSQKNRLGAKAGILGLFQKSLTLEPRRQGILDDVLLGVSLDPVQLSLERRPLEGVGDLGFEPHRDRHEQGGVERRRFGPLEWDGLRLPTGDGRIRTFAGRR